MPYSNAHFYLGRSAGSLFVCVGIMRKQDCVATIRAIAFLQVRSSTGLRIFWQLLLHHQKYII